MAYVNVAEWKTDQVCEWLKGAENSFNYDHYHLCSRVISLELVIGAVYKGPTVLRENSRVKIHLLCPHLFPSLCLPVARALLS